ncbi:MAG: hypothetical protein ACPHCN_18050, partial [Mycobacterium sp.]
PAGAAPSPALGVGSAPAAPSVVAPGVAVPHAVTDRLPTPGPVPPLPPGAPGAGLGPPTDQLGLPLEGQLGSPLDADQMPLLPEAANQQGVPSVTEQFAPVPGAPA